MDKWFLHTDVTREIRDYRSKPGILLPVYSKIESVVEKEFRILLPVKSKVIKSCLEVAEFADEMRGSDKPLTRDTPRGREFVKRIHHRFSIFPDVEGGISRYFRKKSQEDIAIKRCDFSEGRSMLKLELAGELILEDLRKVRRKGLFCFEIFRFSEKTIEELGCQKKDEIEKGDYYIFHRYIGNGKNLRFRMRSFSLTTGKVIIAGN